MLDIDQLSRLEEKMSGYDMTSPEAFFSVFYMLFSVCLIAPPTEFVAAGLTVQNLLANFLGSEKLNFVYYHIKRTAATVVFHSLLPLGYLLGYALFTSDRSFSLLQPWKLGYYWKLYSVTSLILPAAALLLVFYWSRDKWSRHPIARSLKVFVPQGSTWQAVVSSINVEFRRFDKFQTTGNSEGRRVIVTDSWVIRSSTYRVHVAHQNDVHLTLEQAEQHDLSHIDSIGGVQYLTIAVRNIRPEVEPFTIRLLATEYQELKDKLSVPVRNLRNVVIQQSLTDRFGQAFREQVDHNPPFTKPAEMEIEQCIGCMQKLADVKLLKLCADGEGREGEEKKCIQCFCRPMWCLDCMGKWFASRQKQTEPESWMASKAPCPTCRAVFCMLDVCHIVG